MKYTEPLGEPVNDPYDDANIGTAFEGSMIPAGAVEPVMREIVHAITFAGLTPSSADLQQLRKAIQALVGLTFLSYPGTAPSMQFACSQVLSGILAAGRMPAGLITRNHLINGSMNIWQRGPSATFSVGSSATTAAYTADRWAAVLQSAGAGVQTVKRVSYSAEFLNALRWQRTAGATETILMRLIQPLTSEDSAPLDGQVARIAFRARAGANFSGTSGSGMLGCRVRAGTGSDEALSAWFNSTATGFSTLDTADHVVTTSDQEFSRSFTVPSGTRQLAVEFRWAPSGTAGANDYLDITAVRLQLGAETFSPPPESLATELLACQRFYTKTFDYAVAPAQNTNQQGGNIAAVGNGGVLACQRTWQLMVEMRTTPTVVTYNPIAANSSWGAPSTLASYAASVGQIGRRAISIGNSADIPTALRVGIHATADAEL